MFLQKIKTFLFNPSLLCPSLWGGTWYLRQGNLSWFSALGDFLSALVSLLCCQSGSGIKLFLITFCCWLTFWIVRKDSHCITTTLTRISKSSQILKKPVKSSSLISFQLEKYVLCSRKLTGQENTFYHLFKVFIIKVQKLKLSFSFI